MESGRCGDEILFKVGGKARGDEEIWLLIAYTKEKFDNLPTSFLNQLREEIDRG
jgi:hypothetical protein